ncbi:NAD(P)/FAD-dependent oxidoreductase [Rhizobium halophytocola]|uniref:Glycine/D-amino acid oxidase-like deaminating enzyme n=1 Tax=Rhizobium halophytocola TaxID=735519 RepID=A0ABS4DTL3_9HYPH|nr:FAD-binding oxidoreductase [Rhizobium halophytocola]MBP1849041.1 glycine/D-amino acid oxidase-like deaminating enzyme [Rhizobium halophytocola]
MPGPQVVPVQGDEALPQTVDVVVIGGGIIGASAALELAERGISVALCEKGGIGQEQSSRNWGWVRISQRDPREVPLAAEAIRIWSGLDKRVRRDTGYRQCGIVFQSQSDRDEASNERWPDELRQYQLASQMIGQREFSELYPGLKLDVRSALHTAADGRAEPQKAAPAIAEAAREAGAHILTRCAVRGVETAGGRISGVVTERGPIACSSVLLAGGSWSSLFSRSLGVDLPQLKIVNTVIRTTPIEGGPEETLFAKDFAFRRRQDGGYTVASPSDNIADIVPDSFRYGLKFIPALKAEWHAMKLRLGPRFIEEAGWMKGWRLDEESPFERIRVMDPTPVPKLTDHALAKLKAAYPVFARARIAQRWAGLIDVTPDAVPVISPVDKVPGFFIATGFSGHGFGIGPGAGRLAADLVSGATPCVDPTAFRLSRFFDGSRIELGTL